MQATAERPARSGEANPFLRILADVMSGCAALFGLTSAPARRAAPQSIPEAPAAVAAPAPAPVPRTPEPLPAATILAAPLPEQDASVEFPEETRTMPTVLGQRVLAALNGKGPLRKTDIAELVGIGRGSANRIVERLVAEGWMRKAGEDTFGLA